jgi:Mg-chelatase subunit ChlD
MEKDKLATGDSFGDEETWDYIPDENSIDSHVDYNENPEKLGEVDWINGRPVLSFSSLCDKTKSIFTAVKKTKIFVTEFEGDNYIFKRDHGVDAGYVINIPKKPNSGINRYTAFNHELGHYAFDSFNNQFGLHINEELANIPTEHQDKALEIYRTVFNILEDQRVESLMGSIYLGTGKRFKQTRRRLGSMKPSDHKAKDPLDSLHCAREFREDSVPRKFNDAKQIIEKIAKKDSDASIILAKHYIKTTVNPWLLTQLKNLDKEAGDDQSKMKKDPTKPIEPTPLLKKVFKQSFLENRQSDHRELSDMNELDTMEDTKDSIKKSETDLEGSLQDSAKNAKDKIGDIKDAIEKEARLSKQSSMKLTEGVQEHKDNDKLSHSYEGVEPNNRVASQLNKIFKLLQANNKPRISDTGDMISVQEVIRRKSRGYGDIHIKQTPKNSLAIRVSIDASGSMHGMPIKIARDMMATLYKSINGINNISLKGVVWSGSEYNTAVCDVNNIQQTDRIVTHGAFGGGTPTPQGVEYSERQLESDKGKKKLLIVITDGYPNSCSNSNLTPEQMTRKEINRANKKGIITLGIGVGMRQHGSDNRTDDNMALMFGKRGYMLTSDMENTSNLVIKKFRDIVIRQLKR